MSSDPERLLTEKEYLAIERRAEFRSEFYNGEMFALAGASRRHNMVVTNLVIFEVLSDSTEAHDRGRKFEHYQNVDSLLTYVLVTRDPPRIERYVRQRGVRTWIYAESHEADAPFGIEAIDCELRLEDVYAKV